MNVILKGLFVVAFVLVYCGLLTIVDEFLKNMGNNGTNKDK